MKNIFTKRKDIVLGALILLSSSQAYAGLIITTGGQLATDGSGLTSSFIDASNKIDPTGGYLIETFDYATRMIGFDTAAPEHQQDKSHNFGGSIFDTCGINSTAAISVTGNIGVKGDGTDDAHGVGAPPGGSNPTIGDTTCFGYTPGPGSGESVTVDYSGFLTGGVKIDYLGFYWGSIDAYNNFEFFDSTSNTSQVLLGSTLLADSGGTPGSRTSPDSNLYINIAFSDFAFDSFTVTSTGVAGEFDNIVVGLTNRPIPEPSSIALLGLSLLVLLTGTRKRKGKGL